MDNAEARSGIESALYRLLALPTGDVLYPRAPRQAGEQITALIGAQSRTAELYSLRALEEEQALDFTAAERDWKNWAAQAPDQTAAELSLADFYHRRLRAAEEVDALMKAAQAPSAASERFTASSQQRSWQTFDRILSVIRDNALSPDLTDRAYRAWIARYPKDAEPYTQFLEELLNQKRYDDASALIDNYRRAFPSDAVFPIRAQAAVAYRRGNTAAGLAVYDDAFQPLWPAALVESYFALLKEAHSLPRFTDRTRARLRANPDDLSAAARLFYAYQQQGRLDAAAQVIADYRRSKETRKAHWTAQELYTFAELLRGAHNYTEAARYYYALHSSPDAPREMPEAQQRALAGLIGLLLDAPEQPLRLGAGNLSMYRDIATMDQGPGYLNGILSLWLNSTSPPSEYQTENQSAAPYFHRAAASELLTRLDTQFPADPERASLHARLIYAYAVYGDNDAVIRSGRDFLTQFPHDGNRVDVALAMADSYARTNRTTEEFELYDQLLRELAAQAEGVPLGDRTVKYSRPVEGQPVATQASTPTATAADSPDSDSDEAGDETPVPQQTAAEAAAFSTKSATAPSNSIRSPQYEQILDRYLGRLVAMQNLPQALVVLRGELDHDPDDPGIYEKLAQFLDQNQLGQHEEEVYRKAIAQFDDKGWYAKLARFYLRQKRNSDYASLTAQVTKIFSGTELEAYFAGAPGGGAKLSLQVNLYAHERFPHDLTFTRNLLTLYRARATLNIDAWQKLLAQHWFEDESLRNQFFIWVSQSGQLSSVLGQLSGANAEVQKDDWQGLAARNPAAARLLLESDLWQSHFEESAPVAAALAAEYPADRDIGRKASSLYRSLAYFNPPDTDTAVTIEQRLLNADPGDLDTLARIGDIYADAGRFREAAPYWIRMGEARPGVADGYLQSATVFWDYFDFDNALAEIDKGRKNLGNPALYSYEAGAIYENERDDSKAVAEYVRGSVTDRGDDQSRSRLLALSRRSAQAQQVEAATASLTAGDAPTAAAIALRVDVLAARQRKAEISATLNGLLDRTTSLDMLEYIGRVGQNQSLVDVQRHSLERQIALAADPVRRIELRYDLVRLDSSNNQNAAAQQEIDAVYAENPRLLGVVRATVDYDWSHDRRQQAVTVLQEAARNAYPALGQQLSFEAAGKLTDLGQYAQARAVLAELLRSDPYNDAWLAATADTYARTQDNAGLRDFYQAKIAELKDASLDRAAKTTKLATLRRGLIPALTRLNDPATAVDQYIELINVYPEDAGLASEAALYAARYQQQDRLVGFYRKTVGDSPRDARWAVVLARIYTAMEQYPPAIEAYAKAIAIRPDRVDLYTARSTLNERLQHYDEAVADYERLYRLTYKDSSWQQKIAETRARQGKPELAVTALRAAYIEGRPERPENYFNAASKLEGWNMLDEALSFARKGADLAGADLLADGRNQAGAAVYARILTRQHKPELAYEKLGAALSDAEEPPSLAAAAEHVVEKGTGTVTISEWREQQRQARMTVAAQGFGSALRQMADAVHTWYTPEETQSFEQLLLAKSSTASAKDLRQFFLPAARAGALVDLESECRWKLAAGKFDNFGENWTEWVQLERNRTRLVPAAARIQDFAANIPARNRSPFLTAVAQLYRDAGDESGELSALEQLAPLTAPAGEQAERYFTLLLKQKPQRLVELANSGQAPVRNAAAQYAVLNAPATEAIAVIRARGNGLPPVWTSSYRAAAGLYLRQTDADTSAAFLAALGDAAIGERIGQPVDRNRELAGDDWFYYGGSYGRYLSLEQSAAAEDYLPATLEAHPESTEAYQQLADWYSEQEKLPQALAQYELALQISPGSAALYDRMAVVLWKQGRKQEALDAWTHAVAAIAREMDERPVPESFWTDFADVVQHSGSRGQLAALRPKIDTILRAYIRRNGSFRIESLLQAVYSADGSAAEATDRLLDLAASANLPEDVLNAAIFTDWIPDSQRPRLYARLVEIAQQKAAASQGQDRTFAEDDVRLSQGQWLDSLLKAGDFAEAARQLNAVPAEQRRLHEDMWLPIELKVAAHDGALSSLVQRWKLDVSSVPSANLLRNASNGLDRASQDIVLGFVYQQAIDAHQFDAASFLGLAEIRIRSGDVSGAVALLDRMILVADDPYANLDAAAELLVRTGHDAEAIPFLTRLAAAVPWQPSYRLRLDESQINAHSAPGSIFDDLASLARDPSASYEVRAGAARLLAGHRPSSSLGSAELDLLARGSITASEAEQPHFVAARVDAAKNASLPQRILLLREALAIAPQNTTTRTLLLRAAGDAKDSHLMLSVAQPIVDQIMGRYPQIEGMYDAENQDSSPAIQSVSMTPYASGEEQTALLVQVAEARRDIGDEQQALALFRQALQQERDTASRKPIAAAIAELERRIAFRVKNTQRAPQIHETLDQPRPVLPRLVASAERSQP